MPDDMASPPREMPSAVRRSWPSPCIALDRHQVHRRVADEVGDEGSRWAAVDLDRRGVLNDPALVHHRDAGRERHRLGLVVRDVDRRHPHVALQVVEEAARLEPQLGVEVGERLIEEIDAAGIDQRARERRALLLAAGNLARQPIEQMRRS